MAKISNISRERAAQQRELLLILGASASLVAAGLWLASQSSNLAGPHRRHVDRCREGAYHLVGQALRGDPRPRRHNTRTQNVPRLEGKCYALDGCAVGREGRARAGRRDLGVGGANLVSLGRAYQEPLWIFYRGEQTLTRLSDFAGKRLAIGPEGSGTRNLMLKMLEAAKITDPPATILGPETMSPPRACVAARSMSCSWRRAPIAPS